MTNVPQACCVASSSFGRPCEIVFAKRNVQETLGWEHVHGQSAMPESHAEFQLFLTLEVELIAMNRYFKDAVKRSYGDRIEIQQANSGLFHGKFANAAEL